MWVNYLFNDPAVIHDLQMTFRGDHASSRSLFARGQGQPGWSDFFHPIYVQCHTFCPLEASNKTTEKGLSYLTLVLDSLKAFPPDPVNLPLSSKGQGLDRSRARGQRVRRTPSLRNQTVKPVFKVGELLDLVFAQLILFSP